ncbi:MAG TPA: hypothetical protein VIL26_01190 [Clostridia bacterium]
MGKGNLSTPYGEIIGSHRMEEHGKVISDITLPKNIELVKKEDINLYDIN